LLGAHARSFHRRGGLVGIFYEKKPANLRQLMPPASLMVAMTEKLRFAPCKEYAQTGKKETEQQDTLFLWM